MSSIFVAIPAYNERYLDFTVADLLDKASGDNEIKVGVVEQSTVNRFACLEYPNVTHLKQSAVHPTGVCRQRLIALLLNLGSDYVLSVDAHMCFDYGWDKELIDRHQKLVQIHGSRCVISQHLPITVDAGNGTLKKIGMVGSTYKTPGMTIGNERITLYDLGSHDGWYKENYFLTAHFMFSTKDVFDDVPPDPDMYFYGEEHTWALRLWTRNIKMFSTNYAGIGHLDKGNPSFKDVEAIDKLNQNHPQDIRNWIYETDCKSLFKMHKVFCGEIVGQWGAPTKALAQEFINKSGIEIEKIPGFKK